VCVGVGRAGADGARIGVAGGVDLVLTLEEQRIGDLGVGRAPSLPRFVDERARFDRPPHGDVKDRPPRGALGGRNRRHAEGFAPDRGVGLQRLVGEQVPVDVGA
jgi:hypothetical protein